MRIGGNCLAVTLIAIGVVACSFGASDPRPASSSAQLRAAAADADRFSWCVAQLMAGDEDTIRRNVEARYRLSPDDAHDLVHDSLLTVCVQHAERGYVNLGAALQRAAYNRATDDWRRKRRYPQCPVDESVPSCDATDAGVRFDQEERAVEAAMCRLDRVSERIVRQRVIEEMDFAEIGRELGLSADATRTKYNNAIRKLRRDLAAACPAPARENRPTAYTK